MAIFVLNMISELTSMISELSIRDKPEQKLNMLNIWKKILKETRGPRKYTVPSLLKRFLFALYNEETSPADFISACGISDVKVKRLAYLAAMLAKDTDLCIMMVNTLIKDLQNMFTMNYALKYICNFASRDEIFLQLRGTDFMNSSCTINYPKRMVAFYMLNSIDNNFKLVEVSSRYLGLKLQLLVDNHAVVKSTLKVYDNDIQYLKKMFVQTREVNTRILILKFLRIFQIHIDTLFSDGFVNIVEKAVGRAFSEDTYIILGLSYEAAKLLLTYFPDNQISNKFTLHLLGSPKDFYNICALHVVKQFGIQKLVTINFFIDKGLGRMEYLPYLLHLVDEETHVHVYNQIERFRIRLIRCRSKKNFSDEHVLKSMIGKIFILSEEELKFAIMQSHYNYLQHINIENHFEKEKLCALYEYFSALNDISSFKITYQLICYLSVKDCTAIFKQHLESIFMGIKFNEAMDISVIHALSEIMLKCGDLLDNYEILLLAYHKSSGLDLEDERLKVILELKEFLMLLFDHNKFIIDNDFLLWYASSQENQFKKKFTIQTSNRYNINILESPDYVLTDTKVVGARKEHVIELVDFEIVEVNLKLCHDGVDKTYKII